MNLLSRREFIKSGLSFIIAQSFIEQGYSQNLNPYQPLYLPNFSSTDIHLAAGLRPFRRNGLCIEKHSQSLTGKTIYKNYGHGGAGWTLSWGSSTILANQIYKSEQKKSAAVIGAGITGLTTAHELLNKGFKVKIYSDHFSSFSRGHFLANGTKPKTTSDVAGGQWAPSFVNNGHSPQLLKESLIRSYCRFNNIDDDLFLKSRGLDLRELSSNDSRYLREDLFPINHMKNYYFNSDENNHGLSHKKKIPLVLNQFLQPTYLKELPFHCNWVAKDKPIVQYNSFVIDVPAYTKNLMLRLQNLGAVFETTQPFESLSDIENNVDEELIVCCLGYGSKKIFNDNSLKAVRGQLVFVTGESREKNNHIDFCQLGVGYSFPRQDAIILGGTYDIDKTSLTLPDQSYRPIYNKHLAAFAK